MRSIVQTEAASGPMHRDHHSLVDHWQHVTDLNERAVLYVLADPKWDYITPSGIAKRTNIDSCEVQRILAKHSDLVRESACRDAWGRSLYSLRSRPEGLCEKLSRLSMLYAKPLSTSDR